MPHFAGAIHSVFDPAQVESVIEKILVEMAMRMSPGSVIEICFWVVGDEILFSVSDQEGLDLRVPPEMTVDGGADEAEPAFSILSAAFERYGGRIWQDPHTQDYRFTLPYLDVSEPDSAAAGFKTQSTRSGQDPVTPKQLAEEK